MALQPREVNQEREKEIRDDIAKWHRRSSSQYSPHMLMCIDLLILLDSARAANAAMMAEKLAQDDLIRQGIGRQMQG